MRKYFLIISVLAIIPCFSQISSYKIEEKKETSNRTIVPYDSLTNITRENIISLVGQKVQVLPYIPFGGSDLATGPTMFTRLPYPSGYDNSAVVEPDRRFTIYQSRFGAFDNEVFDIVGVDSIQGGTKDYPAIKFFLHVKNEKYPETHYLEVGTANDRYSYNGRLESRGTLSPSNFIILGYFDKTKKRVVGKKLVNRYENNQPLYGRTPIVYNLSDGSPLKSIPKDNIWEVIDFTFVDTKSYKGMSYILSSDSIQNAFCRASDNEFIPYETYIEEKAKREAWERNMIKQYGKVNGKLIIEGKVKLGFTKKMCEEAWGYPSDINKSTGSWGVHEQWVYGGGSYLYFENGRLTSIDN